MTTPSPTRRFLYPTPGWLVILSLAVTGILFLSERFQWLPFNTHKGWTVLIAVASVGVVLALMLLWWILALVCRLRFQFSIRSLLVLVVKASEVMILNWTGPFVMLPQPETRLPYVFGRDGCVGTGIYLLTFECGPGYRVNYVGETGTNIQGRLQAHYNESSKGDEGKAAEPEKFRKGIREIHRFDRFQFQADRPKWSSWIDDNYRAYRVFVATSEKNRGLEDGQIRKDIEAAIIRTLFSEGGDIAAFLYHPNQTKYFSRRSPTPFSIQFPASPDLHGLTGKRIDC